ncbi:MULTISPECIES: hypothetical protein [Mycolicibacterium]|uniref:Uncharacterized protein n=2 Tax=Mycolicibacterium fortuitum TaxID=1766 RepID=A0AAE5AE66_MYCFO|nr:MULTISPECIES: hypothetical protein [Mycolicibacterium]MBU8814036.1 hypothetical protein [Mycolicibacterium goodii]MCV7137707.1 hypothetical protein [Mycolicibacterium fortuitum]MDV7193272.1 hypothetical protein [Mycolicibacterium fortuitum]MDV7206048.1 hypothetical protein [Mycolicibacterium fortuitum]MDV7227460.1 hypothetical protein [Mycolicibacterium fortuitum]
MNELRDGDRVEVASLWAVKPRPGGRNHQWRPGRIATGVIDRFTATTSRTWRGQIFGVVVRFEHPINGETWCTASPDELTKLA